MELSVKSVLALLEIQFSAEHGWEPQKKPFAEIARQIKERSLQEAMQKNYLGHFNLARLLLLMNFWSHLYGAAKYGLEVEDLAPAKDLFKKEDAELAVAHARECYNAAHQFRIMAPEKLVKVVGLGKIGVVTKA